MGAAVGVGGSGRDVNVDLNIIPFIDLMSCLTAFLLVTAVWVQIAQLGLKPKGKSRNEQMLKPEDEKVILSVLIQSDAIWVVQSRIGDQRRIALNRENADTEKSSFQELEATLKDVKQSAYFITRKDMELAAHSSSETEPVVYQHIILAMDAAKRVGFSDIGLTERDSLTAKPQQ
jgi:biopolymer transport protein ExbD